MGLQGAIDEEASDFPSTHWGYLLDLGLKTPEERRRILEELARLYWKPIHTYVRTHTRSAPDDALDLTQDFFAWMIDSDFFSRADPHRGSFRALVKVSLEHYLSSEERKRHRIKRGGDRRIVALDAAPGEPPDSSATARTPEQALDDAWRDEVLSRSVERLEAVLRREHKGLYFLVFRDYYLNETGETDYRKVSETHGISTADVSNYLVYAKRRFRTVLGDVVAETVRDPDEFRAEMDHLFGPERG